MHTEVLRSLGPATMSTVNSQMVQKGSQGSPVVKNLPSNAGDAGSIPSQGAKIPHAKEQLSSVPQRLSLGAARKNPHAASKT